MSSHIYLATGSRNWLDIRAINRWVRTLPEDAIVIEGGGRGADRLVGRVARDHGLHVVTMGALWERFGKGAGPIRNEAMIRLATQPVEAAVAFDMGTPGTGDMMRRLGEADIPFQIVKPSL